MYNLFFIAKNNMKKQKGDMITFFFLTLISAFLIFDCASVVAGLGKILDNRFDEVNGAYVSVITNDSVEENECGKKAFTENKHITDYEASSLISMTPDYRNKNEKEYSQYMFVAESYDDEPEYMNPGIDQSKLSKNDIIIPLYLKNKFAVGDTLQIKLDKKTYDLNVAGYDANPYFCSSTNITVYYIYMSDKLMDELIENHPNSVVKDTYHKGIMDESELTADFTTVDVEHEVTDSYKKLISPYAEKNPEKDYLSYMAVNWQMMKGGSEFLPLIVMGLILIFAVLILAIAIVIICFSIKNFINRNMKNTGILEASGYTVKELRRALSMQILLVSILGTAVGILVATLTFEKFGNVVSIVSGLVWNQPVSIPVMAMTFVGIILVAFLVSVLTSRTYKKISVLDALRGGINTHNFKRNLFSFENTPLPISIVLSLKDTFGGWGRNVVMVMISFILTISALIGFGLYENFGKDAKNIIDFMGFENGNVSVMGSPEMGDDLRNLEDVENVLGIVGIEPTVYFGDNKSNIYTYVYDDTANATMTRIVDGRLPEKDNEVMLTGAAADDIGAKIGDVIEVEIGTKKEEYLIVGLNQRLERMGRTIIMNSEAAERIIPKISEYSYNITCKDDVSFDTMKSRLEDYAEKENLDFEAMHISDLKKGIETTVGTVSATMKVICVVIAFITIVIVVFVESLVIRAKITREWRGMGISKALGQTSRGLISQIMLSNSPAILAGILLGVLVSQPAGAKLCLAMFSLFGMKSMDFVLPIRWIGITAFGIFAVAVITSAVLGLRVRNLKPIDMITEE